MKDNKNELKRVEPDYGRRFGWFLLFAFLFSLQAVPRIWTDSAYTDEVWETTTGYYYWIKGEVTAPLNHPPLANALEAFPLLFMDLKIEPHVWNNSENRAYSLHYVANLPKLESLIVWPRVIAFLFTLGVGFFLFLWVRREEDPVFYMALALWAFEPNLLAFSIVAKADAVISFFCAASLMAFLRGREGGGNRFDFLAGVLTGMAVASKLTALGLLPIYLALDIWVAVKNKKYFSGFIRRWLAGALGFTAAILLVYLPGTLKEADHRFPLVYFYRRIVEALQVPERLHFLKDPYFFCGKFYEHERLWQFPVVLALKTTTPFFIFLFLGILALVLRKTKLPCWVWFFPLTWIMFVHLSPLVYLRYILPVYPMLLMIASKGAGWVWEMGEKTPLRALRKVVVLLGIWGSVSAAVNFPYHAGYFNDFILPDWKWKCLDGHYVDLNQDLKRLGKKAKERGWKNIKLVYSGQDDPYFYGLPLWEPWSLNDLKGPQAGTTYVVQTGFLRSESFDSEKYFPIRRCWIVDAKPTGTVGETWLYYEIPGTPEKDFSMKLDSTPFLVYQNAPYRKPVNP